MGENGGLVIKIIIPSDRGVAKARPGWACARPKFILLVCVSASVTSTMVKLAASARPIPMIWLRH